MKHSIKTGFSFGLTSGVITILGLMVGLYSSTHSRLVVIGGIITIAIADALSDSLGIHISEESERVHCEREIWESTISTFLTKFLFSLLFIIPVLLLRLRVAIIVSIVSGLLLLGIFSFYMSRGQEVSPVKVIMEHLFIAVCVVVITYFVGGWVGSTFGE